MAVIAAAIKFGHPGAPVLFTQSRTGRHGRRFNAFKFRSMVPNAEELKHELRHLNELDWRPGAYLMPAGLRLVHEFAPLRSLKSSEHRECR